MKLESDSASKFRVARGRCVTQLVVMKLMLKLKKTRAKQYFFVLHVTTD